MTDTNILLRLTKRDHIDYSLTRRSVDILIQHDAKLVYTLQNMAEFWGASTRPKERNGFGLTVDETEINAQEIERGFLFLPDVAAMYTEWRRIVLQYKISGTKVHDARLAASMYAHRVTHILTFNTSDFARFEGLTPIHPELFRVGSPL